MSENQVRASVYDAPTWVYSYLVITDWFGCSTGNWGWRIVPAQRHAYQNRYPFDHQPFDQRHVGFIQSACAWVSTPSLSACSIAWVRTSTIRVRNCSKVKPSESAIWAIVSPLSRRASRSATGIFKLQRHMQRSYNRARYPHQQLC